MDKITARFTLIMALATSPCLFAAAWGDPVGVFEGLFAMVAQTLLIGYLIIIAILVGINYGLRKRTVLIISINVIFCLLWISAIIAMRLSLGEIHIRAYFILGIPLIIAIVGIIVALCNTDESQESPQDKENSEDYYALINVSNNEALQHLLANGANINAKNDFGNTALMSASHNGNVDLVEWLLASGADIHIKNNYDKTALDFANSETIKEMLRKAGAE